MTLVKLVALKGVNLMGWLFNRVDEELQKRCLQNMYANVARMLKYFTNKLNEDGLSDIERLAIEINKKKLIEQGELILAQLGDSEFIKMKDDILYKEHQPDLNIDLYIVR